MILNFYASQVVCLVKLLSHLPKNHWILSIHSSTKQYQQKSCFTLDGPPCI